MRFSDSLPTILPLLVGYFLKPAVGGTYDTKLNAVDNHMAQLDYKISELQSVAQTNGHYDVHLLCEDAKDSLQKAQSAWKNIASSYGDKPWLASDSTYKEIVVEHWYSCGSKLESVYEHPNVLPENGDIHHILNRFKIAGKPMIPVNLGSSIFGIGKLQNQSLVDLITSARTRREEMQHWPIRVNVVTAGETACPISAHSTGLECIDVQSELTSCGGCVSKHEGENCMDITGAAGVGCHLGRCVVLSVHPHYFLGQDGRPILKRRRVS
ncbi:hypothetical protein Pst134EA_032648 [Puccinia striiformis f. sp. tritici]|uniref:uncharacterized protein n=1 Tax=Puccinia striiformis f. sp. tritici TaxID=168172 RepID=UPI002007D30C|nr:uncharacterized protein Pst134EA_032648 [Puccinia striiformis f. sp. tritici]KAH9440807.1 hypothetical protein Pst134EA_032648 [Puccinia striiformis f. sp. tritici]